MLAQAGVIRAENLHQLFDIAQLVVHQPLPRGDQVAVVVNSHALAALTADAALSWGLQDHPRAGRPGHRGQRRTSTQTRCGPRSPTRTSTASSPRSSPRSTSTTARWQPWCETSSPTPTSPVRQRSSGCAGSRSSSPSSSRSRHADGSCRHTRCLRTQLGPWPQRPATASGASVSAANRLRRRTLTTTRRQELIDGGACDLAVTGGA